MSAAIKGKKPKYALELFAEMKKIGLDITTITINVAMLTHLKLNEPNKALELFDALEEKDTVSLNTAIPAETSWRRRQISTIRIKMVGSRREKKLC